MIEKIKAKYYRRRDYLQLVFKGYCIGVANIIPGISGGTLAFLLGIYEDLIKAIKSFDLRFVQLLCRLRFKEAFSSVAWQFLGTVFLGSIAAVVTLSKLIEWLMDHKPVLIYSFFFGLILATAPIIIRIIKKWTLAKGAAVVSSAVLAYFFVGLTPLVTPEAAWFIFLCGAVAISTMILPGISGSFVLLLLGKYKFILNAVNQWDYYSLGIFILGIIVGLILFVRILNWLFTKYHDLTVTVITGILIGSLRKIWPWKEVVETITISAEKIVPVKEINALPAQWNGDVILALGIMAVGFFLTMALNSSSDGKLLS